MKTTHFTKKISLGISLSVLLTSALPLGATNLWSGTTVMPANWGAWVPVAASSFASVEVGDTLQVTVADILVNPMMQINNGNWTVLRGTGAIVPTSDVCRFIVTTGMKTELLAGGINLSGCNYTATSIDLLAGNGGAGLEDAVWLGSVATGNYVNFAQIAASAFADAQVGDLLRMKIADLQIGAQGHLFSGSWGDLTDATAFVTLSGSYFQFTITAAMLAQLQTDGCVVSGAGYTLTGVYVVDPASLVTLNATVPVVNNWVWNSGQTPQITVNVSNPNAAAANARVVLSVMTDKLAPVDTYTQSLAVPAAGAQSASFSLPLTEPGFYKCLVTVNDETARSFNIGYRPKEIVSEVDALSDFQNFWNTAKADLAAVAPNYSLTLIPENSTAARNVYRVDMHSVGDLTGSPITISGYYAEPTGAATYPAIITYLGYDSDQAIAPYCMGGDDNPNYIELILSCRGQSLNRVLRPNPYGDWFVYSLGNKDDYYYRGAYMDVVRGIDFIASRPKVQAQHIFALGGSQGGAFTLAAAALDTRLRAIAVSIPFMGDFPDYFQIGAWPAYPAAQKQAAIGLSDADMYTMLSYFDTKNLAPNITCPVIMTLGLQDPVCPPHTNMAPYNNLTNVADTDKRLSINAELEHSVPLSWYYTYMAFFESYMNTTTQAETTTTPSKYWADGTTLHLEGVATKSVISVFNVAGQLVAKTTTTTDNATLSLPQAGVYFVMTDNDRNNMIKLIVK